MHLTHCICKYGVLYAVILQCNVSGKVNPNGTQNLLQREVPRPDTDAWVFELKLQFVLESVLSHNLAKGTQGAEAVLGPRRVGT